MRNQPTRVQLRQRTDTIKIALIEADIKGTTVSKLLALATVYEPDLNINTLAVWISMNRRKLQAERSVRRIAGRNYMWYHRGKSITDLQAHEVSTQRRVVTITLPSLPRITPLRIYALAITAYSIVLTILAVS